jgi:thiosulfate dehydrogenase [quinone] large subunit
MNHHTIEEPKFVKFILQNPKFAWFWLIIRVYVGWQWLEAGWDKIHNAIWVGPDAGGALTGFVNGALGKMGGTHPDVSGWYGWFLQHAVLPHASLWSHMVAYGEFLVGIALIVGILTGIAAFFGLFMNLNYLLAGTVSTNPILFILALGLVLAWRVAGFLGLDYWVLPAIGTPWHKGTLTGGE